MQTVTTRLSTAQAVTTLACTDLAAAKRFYQDMLGFDVEERADAPGLLFIHAGHGSEISVYERPEPSHCDATAVTFLVDDLDATMDDLRSRGIGFLEYDLAWVKTVNGVATQGTSRTAWFMDPGGNTIAITQM